MTALGQSDDWDDGTVNHAASAEWNAGVGLSDDSAMRRLDAAAKAVAVELGFCDPEEWDTEAINSDDRDCAYRAAGAALEDGSELTPEELDELTAVLRHYAKKFGFPDGFDYALVQGALVKLRRRFGGSSGC